MKYPSQFLLVFYTSSTPASLSNMDSSYPDPQLLPQSWQDDLKGFEYQKNLQLVFFVNLLLVYELDLNIHMCSVVLFQY